MEITVLENAIRTNLMFPNPVNGGTINLNDVYNLNLEEASEKKLDLDKLECSIKKELNAVSVESSVKRKSATTKKLETQLAIVQRVVVIKQAEKSAYVDSTLKRNELADLEEVIKAKRSQALADMTIEELEARAKALKDSM